MNNSDVSFVHVCAFICMYIIQLVTLNVSGQLEWQDKKAIVPGPSSRITRSLGCMVSIALTDQDMYVLTHMYMHAYTHTYYHSDDNLLHASMLELTGK